jgi:hypothetical protein
LAFGTNAQAFKQKYKLQSLIIVADAGLLSAENINEFINLEFPFILGRKIKNETEVIQQQILAHHFTNETILTLSKPNKIRLMVIYSSKRAKKDEHLLQQGLERLEKRIKSGKFTKQQINNRASTSI